MNGNEGSGERGNGGTGERGNGGTGEQGNRYRQSVVYSAYNKAR